MAMGEMKLFLIAAAIFGLTGVVLGAFGAHGLKGVLTADQLASYETGVRYQLLHAVVLLVVATLLPRTDALLLHWAGYLFISGIILFSVSIYLLALRNQLGITTWQWLGPITPLGGLCLIAGWLTLAIWAIRLKP
jgi:uncharacterized membrane protein YgdD (TMEM256/DUF423 family)